MIGSRTELLHYLGDVIANPAQGIVAAVRDTARRVGDLLTDVDHLVIVFGEVFGGRTSSGARESAP